MRLTGTPRVFERIARPAALIVALQMAVSGLVMPAQAGGIDPDRTIMNGTLPVPLITPRQVAQIMKAPVSTAATAEDATTSGAISTKAPVSTAATAEDATTSGALSAGVAATTTTTAPGATTEPGVSAGTTATADGAPAANTDPAPIASAGETSGEAAWPANYESGAGAADGEKLALGVMPGATRFGPGGPIIIDNDEDIETAATIEYEDLPTDEGATRVKAGARFPVVITSQITSRTAKLGDTIQARLKYDLKIGDKLIAQKGAVVRGHISYALKARTIMGSMLSLKRWYRNSGAVGIAFDEIINEKGEHLPLVAQAARKSRIIKNKGEGRVLGVNHNGVVVGPWSQQLRYKAIRVGLNAALAPAGVFSFGAMPVALGVIGAVNPSFAFSKPVGLNVRHRRLKGFAWGFLSGFPGSWVIEDTIVRGQEAIIKPGDEFLVEFRQEFTGEPATDAQLLPGASTKVRGQVLDGGKKEKKERKDKK